MRSSMLHLFFGTFCRAASCCDKKAFKLLHRAYSTAAVELSYRLEGKSFSSLKNLEQTQKDDEICPSPSILLHGLLGCKQNFSTFAKFLKTPYVVLADLRNHGDSPHVQEMDYASMAADVVRLMDKLGITTSNLIGHSLGGKVAMATALLYPSRVEHFVSLDMPNADFSNPENGTLPLSREGYSTQEVMKVVTSFLKHDFSGKRRQEIDKKLSEIAPRMTPAIRSFILQNLKQMDDGSWTWRMNLNSINNTLNSELLQWPFKNQQFLKKSLFIRGEHSTWINETNSKRILQQFPFAIIKVVENAGHWVHTDNPIQTADMINFYLNSAV